MASPAEAAEAIVKAWASREWIVDAAKFPAAPKDIEDLYRTHLGAQEHPAAAELGGHGGYKLGAVGALDQTCFYAPLFRNFLLDAPSNLSHASCQVHQVEPEFGFLLGADLESKADGSAYAEQEVWAAIESVVLCIEFCGRRASLEILAEQPPLGKFADLLSAGGVILGPRLATTGMDASVLAGCKTSMSINGAEVCSGSGSACPEGSPLRALVWLANHLNSRGLGLQKGQLVITGATCFTRELKPGDKVAAVFEGLGNMDTTLEP